MVTEPVVEAKAATSDSGLVGGNCGAARRLADSKLDLEVDSLPVPIKQVPAALTRIPAGVIKPNVPAEVQIDVVIDTLGKAEMSTFKVVKTTHPWLASNVKSVIGKWTFSPAQIRGCKVRRIYHFSATSAPPKRKGPTPAHRS